MRAQEGHQLTAFELESLWEWDSAFRLTLYRLVSSFPSNQTSLSPQELSSRLTSFSNLVKDEIRPISESIAEPSINPEPKLIQFDHYGKRVDKLLIHQGWKDLTAFSFEQGIVGEAYGSQYQQKWLESSQKSGESAGGRDRLGSHSRIWTFARNYIYTPECHVNLCPTSMQDGLVRTLELYGTKEQKERYLEKLLSRDPNEGWTAGQWMTERAGGSDVSMTETTAERVIPLKQGETSKGGDRYLISGFKWFSSAADGQVALALARTNPDLSLGSRGLSAFIIPIHKKNRPALPSSIEARIKEADVRKGHSSSPYNGILIHRLKNKLGTKMVPTAELELDEAVGELIGQEGRGVALISSVLNLTRLYSATGSVSAVGRALHIASAHASVRRVGIPSVKPPGVLLQDLPLHASRLARVSVTHRAILQLVWLSVVLLGRSESGVISPREATRLRLLTPVAKGFAAHRATECYAACIEACGGLGMMSENQLGTILRDATVERIWEGTPSVLSLDVARVLYQTQGKALQEFCQDQIETLDRVSKSLGEKAEIIILTLKNSIQEVDQIFKGIEGLSLLKDARSARALLDLIAIFTCGVGLLEQVEWIQVSDLSRLPKVDREVCDAEIELEAARRWVLGNEGQLSDSMREIRELSNRKVGGIRSEDLEKRLVFPKL